MDKTAFYVGTLFCLLALFAAQITEKDKYLMYALLIVCGLILAKVYKDD